MGLFRFRERHPLQRECGPWQRASADTKCGVVGLHGLGVSCANEWGSLQLFLGERRLPGHHGPGLLAVPWSCPGTTGCVACLLTEGQSLIRVRLSAI